MEAHTICAICDHSYNSSVKRPLVLPCSHSFCQECLQQVEAVADKRCPFCRKTWGDVRLSDLLSCYQLIPAGGMPMERGIKRARIEVMRHEGACGEHDLAVDIWCESCEVSACKKCWRRDHKDCKIMLLEEKVEALKEIYSLRLTSLKEEVITKYQVNSSNSTTDLVTMKLMEEKMRVIGSDLVEYQTSLESWRSEVSKVVNNDMSHDNNIQMLCDNIAGLEKLESQVPEKPSSLVQSIANAYQNSENDVEAFITNLRSVLDVFADPGDSTSPRTEETPTARLSVAEAAEALKDGEVWTIVDRISAAAVRHVLHNTSVRPKKINITYTDLPEHTLGPIKTQCTLKQYEVDVKVKLDCFTQFHKPSAETIAATTSRLDALVTPLGWATLTQFCGHLNAAALQKLPTSITSVGLVLRDKGDMAAVNALWDVAFSKLHYSCSRQGLIWPNWTVLNLSLAKTFRPDYWKLNWQWKVNTGATEGFSLPTALPALGITLRLHLPQLVPGDRLWMADLFRSMGLKKDGTPVALHLPGARFDLDILLGVLRDSGQLWTVHLPASLTQQEQREEMAERYKRYGHSVAWDLK